MLLQKRKGRANHPGVSKSDCRNGEAVFLGMGQPHKGDRILLQSPNPTDEALLRAVHARAGVLGMSISQYLADVLAINVGRPDLVRDLDEHQRLDLDVSAAGQSAGSWRPLPRSGLLQTRPPRPVWEAVRMLATKDGVTAAQYLANIAAESVGRPDLVHGRNKGEGLPLAM